MAKKNSKPTKSPAAPKTRKPPAAKAAAKARSKKSQHPHHDHDQHGEQEEQIELDRDESKAVDLVLESEDLRNALEMEVNTVVTQAVRKVCKAHGASLTIAQAQNVAMMLFGDDVD